MAPIAHHGQGEPLAVPTISFIVPALNEAQVLPLLLRDIATSAVEHEVVVADGGSVDGTAEAAEAAGARVVWALRGRGTQLARGAAAARGRLFCFLHADARLGADAVARIDALSQRPCDDRASVFRLRIEAAARRYRVIEAGTNLRSRWLGLPYGDQGLILSRALYDRVGGYPLLPLMEDVAMVRSLQRTARVRMLPEHLTVSARRWERDGVIRRTLGNWGLLAAYLAGVDPVRLAAHYRPHAAAAVDGGME